VGKSSSPATSTGPWGALDLERGGHAYLRIGPLELGLARKPREWQVWHARGDDPLDDRLAIERDEREAPSGAEHARFGFQQEPARVRLTPVLADRPVVLRPETPLFIPAGETVDVYASTPMFARIDFDEDDVVELEVPTYRMSDTWFGPTTGDGELCYASRTHAQLAHDLIRRRPHRAITQITVKNGDAHRLHVERLKLPVQYLSVFRAADGGLWTEALTFSRAADSDNAQVSVKRTPPDVAGAVEKLCPPRRTEQNPVVRVFDALLSKERTWSS